MKISHTMSISTFLTDLCAIRQKKKNKKHFSRYCLQCFSREKVLQEHRETCLKINGKQCVKLKSGSIKFKNNFKQLAVSFKIYINFESILKWIKINRKNNTSYTEKYQDHIPCGFAYKVACTDDKFSKPLVLYRVKNEVNKFIEAILKEYDYCKEK